MEIVCEATKRQVKDSAAKASKRELESSAETLLRQEQDRVCTGVLPASESNLSFPVLILLPLACSLFHYYGASDINCVV